MKNFFKFLGIIALVAIIGFSMAGCKTEEEEESSDDVTGSKSGVVEWPADITFDTGTLGNKKGSYTAEGNLEMNINGTLLDTAQECRIYGGAKEIPFIIKAVSGKKITVNDFTADVVFCTDYTVSGTTLVLTGGEGVFAPHSGITWTRK